MSGKRIKHRSRSHSSSEPILGESHVLLDRFYLCSSSSLFFPLLQRSSAAIISSLFFTVRATRDPLPNYHREDNHPWTNRLPAAVAVAVATTTIAAAVAAAGQPLRPREESPGENPVIIIPASNASPGHDGGGASKRQRGRESFLAKLLTALRISARETLATRGWAKHAGQSRRARERLRAAALRTQQIRC